MVKTKKKKKKEFKYSTKARQPACQVWVSPRGSLIDTNTFFPKKYIRKKNTAGRALRHNMEIESKMGWMGE